MSSQNENNFSNLESFSYFISHNGFILVASIVGLCEGGVREVLAKCKAEIEEQLANNIQGVVLNFSGVTGVANDLVPFWAQLQVAIRGHGIELRVCGVETTLKAKLHKLGVLRATETTNTLKEAVLDVVVTLKRKVPPSAKKAS